MSLLDQPPMRGADLLIARAFAQTQHRERLGAGHRLPAWRTGSARSRSRAGTIGAIVAQPRRRRAKQQKPRAASRQEGKADPAGDQQRNREQREEDSPGETKAPRQASGVRAGISARQEQQQA